MRRAVAMARRWIDAPSDYRVCGLAYVELAAGAQPLPVAQARDVYRSARDLLAAGEGSDVACLARVGGWRGPTGHDDYHHMRAAAARGATLIGRAALTALGPRIHHDR